ncbi:hypothetical protein [Phenylobacterium sp.]|uniref:hypothetical protein n=1 Tax=Phenylobacterium sp. TaxID=1871053 RepID=UPI00286D024B|nr:hypothetical protein [Phenylobacterium sp.]
MKLNMKGNAPLDFEAFQDRALRNFHRPPMMSTQASVLDLKFAFLRDQALSELQIQEAH